MNLEFFIARRLQRWRSGEQALSRPAVRIATAGIAIGVAVMLSSVAIVFGFKNEIRNKVVGFGSHIQIANYDDNRSFETRPIQASDSLLSELRSVPNVRHAQRFATKPGIIKTGTEVQGVILKGIDADFDWNFYRPNLIKGDTLTLSSKSSEAIDTITDLLPPPPSREALISKYLSDLLQLDIGDEFLIYFVSEDNIRARKLKVNGIYSTHFTEYDRQFILSDIRNVQQLNNWTEDQASGIEVLVHDYGRLEETTDELYFKVSHRLQTDGSALLPQNIEQLKPEIFSWLEMLDINVIIILVLMLIVAGINMISGLLILILERTNMIGILKALGSRNWSIRKIFLFQASFLILRGLVIGNLIGLTLILVQHYTHIIPLDADTYYVSYVPMDLNLLHILAINAGTFLISVLMLILPSYIISRISPARSIHFE